MKVIRFLLFLLVLLGVVAPAPASADEPTLTPAQHAERVRQIKELQIRSFQAKPRRVLFGSPQPRVPGEIALRRKVDPEYRLRRPSDADYIVPEGKRLAPQPGAVRAQDHYVALNPERTRAITTNVPVNDPAGEELGSSQNEPSIAARGSYVLAAYNDWPSLLALGSIQGYSYSVNGGQSFTDGGEIPAPNGYIWTSDPVITVNEKNGDFFYCGLLEDTLEDLDPKNAVGVVRGIFSGATFNWSTPGLIRVVRNAEHFLDKPWIAADSSSGNVYLTYSDFFPVGTDVSNTIQFVRSRDRGVTWDPELTINSPSANGSVQGARPVLGPNGEVYVVWKEIGPIDPGSDLMRIRKSANRGNSFAPENTVCTFFDNYGTGAPGFNREKGVALPSIAVDRSRNANRGRLYVAWNESLDWYDDLPDLGPTITETEYNDYFADPDVFTIGQTLLGTFRDARDYDSWAFMAEQDSSYVFWADTVSGSTYRLRVWCADSLTRLTYTGHPDLPLDDFGNQSIMVFTAPTTGLYYLDMTNANIEGRAPGTYRILTGPVRHGGERGRDQRDVFVATSADAATWSTPLRVNEEPPRYDDWLPEVTTAASGEVYLAWFDWRDAGGTQCGGLSSVYAALSDNGGSTWSTLGALSDQLSNWTYVNSNLIPNQGDYLGLYANENNVYAAWTDGRLGTPDIIAGLISLLPVELQVSGIATLEGAQVTIDWQFVLPRVVEATVYRRDGVRQVTLANVSSDAAGHIRYTDSTAVRGVEYVYSLGIQTDEGERIVGEVVVNIAGVSLLVAPNPMRGFGVISYSVPDPGAAVEVMIHDITGRRVRRLVRDFRTSGEHQVGWNALDDDRRLVKPGVYLVRVTIGGATRSKRVTVMP
jgi:hypothetical protein